MNSQGILRTGGAFVAASVITLGIALVAGCGGGSTSTPPTTAPTAPTATSTQAPATTTSTNAVVKVGNLEISNIRARTTVTDTTAVYLTIKNNGAADTLLSVAIDPALAGMAQVHEVVTTGGTMAMQELKSGLPVPANGTVELKSGSYHTMVMNVKKPVAAGDIVPITLVFDKAGSVAIKAPATDDVGASSTGMGSSSPVAGGMSGPSPSPASGGMGGAMASPTTGH
jgi:copper(I)-binding protein